MKADLLLNTLADKFVCGFSVCRHIGSEAAGAQGFRQESLESFRYVKGKQAWMFWLSDMSRSAVIKVERTRSSQFEPGFVEAARLLSQSFPPALKHPPVR